MKERDSYFCQLCHKKFDEDDLVIDHIYPYSLGGSNETINLMSACGDCNGDKGKKLDYYKSVEGKEKLKENITVFVQDLPIIKDFVVWLRKMGRIR